MHHGEESSTNDRVWIRGSNTDSWVQIYDLWFNQGSSGNWNTVSGLDIDATLAGASPTQTVSSTFQIRFGQQDNFPATSTTTSDGYTFDDISITGSIPVTYTWNGTINTNWNEPGNWSGNVVPGSTSVVFISASASNWPIFTGNFELGTHCLNLTMEGNSEMTITGDLTIPSGRSFTCNGANILNVGGNWTNNGSFNPGTGTVEFNGASSATISGSGSKGTKAIVDYTLSTFPVGMTDLTGASSGPSGDDGSGNYNIGFTFNYDDVDYTQVHICTNGWISLNLSGGGNTQNTNLFASSDPNTSIAPWWDDINATGGAVYYKTEGTAPNQVFIVEWNSVLTYWNGATARLNFQLKLYETTNVIEFHYGNVESGTHSGSESASIGIENATGGSGNFIEATTGSTTTGVTNLVSPGDWPAVNYRFSPPSTALAFNNIIVSKDNATLENSSDLSLNGDFTVNPDASFTNNTGNTIEVSGDMLLEADDTGRMASYIDNGTTSSFWYIIS